MKLLVFDTETTGLPPKYVGLNDVIKWPHVIQLSYMLYDNNKNKILVEHDHLIQIAGDIPEESTNIHGITKQMTEMSGICMTYALELFHICLEKADIVIAHNLSFDRNMIIVESIREKFTHQYSFMNKTHQEYCTMNHSIQLCNLLKVDKYGNTYQKYPKLIELHQHLFQTTPSGLHNALIDIYVCLRCYYCMVYKKDICIINKSFGKKLNKYINKEKVCYNN